MVTPRIDGELRIEIVSEYKSNWLKYFNNWKIDWVLTNMNYYMIDGEGCRNSEWIQKKVVKIILIIER